MCADCISQIKSLMASIFDRSPIVELVQKFCVRKNLCQISSKACIFHTFFSLYLVACEANEMRHSSGTKTTTFATNSSCFNQLFCQSLLHLACVCRFKLQNFNELTLNRMRVVLAHKHTHVRRARAQCTIIWVQVELVSGKKRDLLYFFSLFSVLYYTWAKQVTMHLDEIDQCCCLFSVWQAAGFVMCTHWTNLNCPARE